MNIRSPRKRNLRIAAGCLAIFASSTVLIFPFISFSFPVGRGLTSLESSAIWVVASLALAVTLSNVIVLTDNDRLRLWRLVFPLALLLIGFLRGSFRSFLNNLPQYGDTGQFELDGLINGNSRWLLGVALIKEAYFLFRLLFIHVDAETFVQVLGSVVMFSWSVFFWMNRRDSVSPLLIAISPIWILFSIGYDEYYPFIAGILVMAILKITSTTMHLSRTSAYFVAGVLPILYIGAIYVSVCLLVAMWVHDADWVSRAKGTLLTITAAILSIEIGGDLGSFSMQLAGDTPRGGTMVGSLGVEAPEGSIFSPVGYLVSLTHLIDVWFWFIFGTGGASLFVAVLALILQRNKTEPNRVVSIRKLELLDQNRIAKLLLLVFAFGYMFLMLPLLGPTQDIDLFFISIFAIILLVGSRLDRLIGHADKTMEVRRIILRLAPFGFAPATTALVVFGISR